MDFGFLFRLWYVTFGACFGIDCEMQQAEVFCARLRLISERISFCLRVAHFAQVYAGRKMLLKIRKDYYSKRK
ncbi:hypothetical protein BKP45_08005 [Anaerobacillus alkalidiazotrophicus]|uniref:Uncharacterized protein n=1 Tax=Anaerobacillus alkalidiazotrophicus TaxID=472963 RepID=A0A1S2M7X3_9BACI|nr:hypothetical protein BKP45_08005 [Anaerobacillus alkalidiazotrophicus]